MDFDSCLQVNILNYIVYMRYISIFHILSLNLKNVIASGSENIGYFAYFFSVFGKYLKSNYIYNIKLSFGKLCLFSLHINFLAYQFLGIFNSIDTRKL